MSKIQPFRYYFPKNTIEWIITKTRELLESSDFLTLGRYNEEFERKFAEYIGSKYAIAVSNGTAALEIILRAIDVRGCDVIVPTNTFAATAFAVIHAGARPIFVDIDSDLNIDPADVKKKLTSKTKVIVPVHIGGLISPRIYELLELANGQGVYVVEDAAHAHGSMLDHKKAGSFGVAASFSFFSTKVMTTGEGGMITTSDDEIAGQARLLRNQGKIRGNVVGILGYNWRMTEIQAIIGLAQLSVMEEIIKERTRIARIYDELLVNVPVLQLLKISENFRHNYYKYIVFLPKGCDPEVLGRHLKEKYSVSLSGYVYEAPLHRQSVFREYVNDLDSYPIADDLCSRHIAPPVYPQMTDEEAQYVCESLKQAIQDIGWI